MPQITVFVREGDLSAWKAIDKKSEWMHEHLSIDILKNRVNGQKVFYEKPIKTPKNIAKPTKDYLEDTGFISKSFSARKKK